MGRRRLRFNHQSQSEFAKTFSSLCQTKSSWEVWSDFVTLSAIAIVNAVDQKEETHNTREREYSNIIQGYSTQERDVFPHLLAQMITSLVENPEQDFLGGLFMLLDLGNHWKGQFFTPYDICRLMAAIVIRDREPQIQQHGWTNICDPCCGAGALLIAARNEMIRHGFGPDQALYVAQDVDRTAALMCYLQLSLLGCAGYVVVGNSLTQPIVNPTGSPLLIAPTEEQEIWLMPGLNNPIWLNRIQQEKLKCVKNASEEDKPEDNNEEQKETAPA